MKVFKCFLLIIGIVTTLCNCNYENLPSPPSKITTTITSSNSITINWSDVSYVDGYYIYRGSPNNSEFIQEIKFTKKGSSVTTTYIDENLSRGNYYYYKVSSFNKNGESPLSSSYSYKKLPELSGESINTAIKMTRTYTDYDLNEELKVMYFMSDNHVSCSVFLKDREYSSDYTSDVVVDILSYPNNYSSLQIITFDGKPLSDIDLGNGSNRIFINDWFRTYYVRVKPKNGDVLNKGTFAITY